MLQLITYVALFANAGSAAEMSRPMSEMHGDCSNYKMNVKPAMTAWEKPAGSVSNYKGKAAMPLNQRVSLELREQAQVKFIDKPEKDFPVKGKSYGEIFTFRAEKDGNLNVAAGTKIWFDVVDADSKKIVGAEQFEMQTGCNKVFKFVRYAVKKDATYFLQVSSSATPQADFAIVQE